MNIGEYLAARKKYAGEHLGGARDPGAWLAGNENLDYDKKVLMQLKALSDIQRLYPDADMAAIEKLVSGGVPAAYGAEATTDPAMQEYVKRQRLREALSGLTPEDMTGLLYGGAL